MKISIYKNKGVPAALTSSIAYVSVAQMWVWVTVYLPTAVVIAGQGDMYPVTELHDIAPQTGHCAGI
jgi:hypothetical protein